MYIYYSLIQSSDDRTTKCINNYKLLADMKINRNKIYEFNKCSTIKDQAFINQILEGKEKIERDMVSIIYMCIIILLLMIT